MHVNCISEWNDHFDENRFFFLSFRRSFFAINIVVRSCFLILINKHTRIMYSNSQPFSFIYVAPKIKLLNLKRKNYIKKNIKITFNSKKKNYVK